MQCQRDINSAGNLLYAGMQCQRDINSAGNLLYAWMQCQRDINSAGNLLVKIWYSNLTSQTEVTLKNFNKWINFSQFSSIAVNCESETTVSKQLYGLLESSLIWVIATFWLICCQRCGTTCRPSLQGPVFPFHAISPVVTLLSRRAQSARWSSYRNTGVVHRITFSFSYFLFYLCFYLSILFLI